MSEEIEHCNGRCVRRFASTKVPKNSERHQLLAERVFHQERNYAIDLAQGRQRKKNRSED